MQIMLVATLMQEGLTVIMIVLVCDVVVKSRHILPKDLNLTNAL